MRRRTQQCCLIEQGVKFDLICDQLHVDGPLSCAHHCSGVVADADKASKACPGRGLKQLYGWHHVAVHRGPMKYEHVDLLDL